MIEREAWFQCGERPLLKRELEEWNFKSPKEQEESAERELVRQTGVSARLLSDLASFKDAFQSLTVPFAHALEETSTPEHSAQPLARTFQSLLVLRDSVTSLWGKLIRRRRHFTSAPEGEKFYFVTRDLLLAVLQVSSDFSTLLKAHSDTEVIHEHARELALQAESLRRDAEEALQEIGAIEQGA